jgi:hypothetical protein
MLSTTRRNLRALGLALGLFDDFSNFETNIGRFVVRVNCKGARYKTD